MNDKPAAGPWIKSTDNEPPLDFKLIFIQWGLRLPRLYRYDRRILSWIDITTGETYNLPTAFMWAEINPPEGV